MRLYLTLRVRSVYSCMYACVCVRVAAKVELGFDRSKVNADHPTLTGHMQDSCSLQGSSQHLHNIGKVLSHVLSHVFPFNVWIFVPGPLEPIKFFYFKFTFTCHMTTTIDQNCPNKRDHVILLYLLSLLQ